MKTLISLCLLAAIVSCNGQDYQPGGFAKVYPGDDQLDVTKVAAHSVKYSRRGGNMEYRLSKTTRDSRELLMLTIRLESGNKVFPDTLFFDPTDLSYAGRRLVNYSQGYRMKVEIHDGEMSAALSALPDSDWERVGDYQKHYDHGLFEIAVMNYFIKALDLKEGLKVSMPFFIFQDEFPVGWVDVVVEGKENLKIEGQTYKVWKVQSLGGKNGDKTFWISDDFPYALKIHSKKLRPWTFAGKL